MAYFDRFPLMAYDVKGNEQYKLLPNILKRVKLRSGIRSGTLLFDNYDVTDGERPEDIAFKLYGDHRDLHSFPTRRSSDLIGVKQKRT